jgi:hypothetical protein
LAAVAAARRWQRQENEQRKHQKSPHDKDGFIGSAFL